MIIWQQTTSCYKKKQSSQVSYSLLLWQNVIFAIEQIIATYETKPACKFGSKEINNGKAKKLTSQDKFAS